MLKRWLRWLCWLTALFCLAFGIAPVFSISGIHAGMVGLIAFGACTIGLLFLWDGRLFHVPGQIRRTYGIGQPFPTAPPRPPRWWLCLRRVWAGVLVCCSVAGFGLSVWMFAAGYLSAPVGGQPYTVVVLGCQVIGDQPSLMLRRRLDAAYGYLESHQDTPVVVSGGLGVGNQYSEAEVMRLYLINRGIAAERIYMESASSSTLTNFSGSAEIIAREGLPSGVAVASDGFHQLRAEIYAKKCGLAPVAALPATSAWGLLPGYWVREWFGVIKALVLD